MEKVLVALSGGVDSSVAAALLLDQGYGVETCTFIMRGINEAALESARSIARSLNVVHHEFDVSKEFEEHVVRYFVNEYQSGATPNPCVICNAKIKFDVLVEKAQELGCSRIATGHYARIHKRNGGTTLMRGADRNEQSYFLYRLQQHHLQNLLLPLGGMTRDKVEAYARDRGLPGARRRKSQDVCFVPDNDYPGFLKKYRTLTPGPILDTQGNIFGTHKGIVAYTIGQRRGLGISAPHPLYVLRIDAQNNAIIVGEKKDVYGTKVIAGDLNFILFDVLDEAIGVYAKPRYVSDLNPVRVEPVSNTEIRVIFSKPQWALTPGQSVVFYQDDVLVGGGVIREAIRH